jgi:hypothetical protein
MLEFSAYHKILRISVVVIASVLLFQGGFVNSSTARLAQSTQMYLANAVGVYVGVAPTELNQITAGLTERTLALDQREQALAEREIDIGLQTRSGISQSHSTFILGAVLFILLVLIILNYALDFIRIRESERVRREIPVP